MFEALIKWKHVKRVERNGHSVTYQYLNLQVLNIFFILQQYHMATNRPHGDLVGWRMKYETFSARKNNQNFFPG